MPVLIAPLIPIAFELVINLIKSAVDAGEMSKTEGEAQLDILRARLREKFAPENIPDLVDPLAGGDP